MREVRELVFLKLGGSLITDKNSRYTVRRQRLAALVSEIQSALSDAPSLRLVLGHGSGSFGHYAVQENLPPGHDLAPLRADEAGQRGYWAGHAEVWYRASELNRHVVDALHAAGVPAISLAPSAMVQAADGLIRQWDLSSTRAAIESGVMPVIYGDIVFDTIRGGSILSTEALMLHLAPLLRPKRILLAGLEAAVWKDYPSRNEPIRRITPSNYAGLAASLGGSHGTDVTGGMKTKVQDMLAAVTADPGLTVQILSGEVEGNVRAALAGATPGTTISGD